MQQRMIAVGVALLLAALPLSTHAFSTPSVAFARQIAPTTALSAGFGGGDKSADSSKKKKKKEAKLKPKQQWDRYIDFKKDTKVRVAVKPTAAEEWLEVGRVKSKNNQYTAIAVARQRAIIAEHAKRLYPMKVSAKIQVEWAYFDDDKDDWAVVDKAVLTSDDVPAGVEKLIGFEGRPDPGTGFYCIYDDGRLRQDGRGEKA